MPVLERRGNSNSDGVYNPHIGVRDAINISTVEKAVSTGNLLFHCTVYADIADIVIHPPAPTLASIPVPTLAHLSSILSGRPDVDEPVENYLGI